MPVEQSGLNPGAQASACFLEDCVHAGVRVCVCEREREGERECVCENLVSVSPSGLPAVQAASQLSTQVSAVPLMLVLVLV